MPTKDSATSALDNIQSAAEPREDPVALPSVFADEHSKQPAVVFPGLATAGFQFCSVRFVNLSPDPSAPPAHIEDLTNDQVDFVRQIQGDYGLATTSLGGRIGKVRFSGQGDRVLVKKEGRFQETAFDDYLGYCERCFEITRRLESRLYRLFPFYAPENEKDADWFDVAVNALGRVVALAGKYELLAGVETEANLIAPDGHSLVRLVRQLAQPNLGIVFDAGNMRTMGYSIPEIVGQFEATLPYLLWFHIKDYDGPVPDRIGGKINEDLLKHFVPCDRGHAGHPEIFRLLRRALPSLNEKTRDLGLAGFFLELEPHVSGGGQFGGYSAPEGIGIALRALERLCDFSAIQLPLRTFDDMSKNRTRSG